MSQSGVDDAAARKAFLADNAMYLLVGFLVVAALGGYLVFDTMTKPAVETDTLTQKTGTWTTDSNFSHGATVREPSRVFPEDRHLSDRPSYFTKLMPILEGEYVIEHWGVNGPVSGSIQLDLVLRSTESIDGSTVTHWETRETIDTEEFDDLSPGEPGAVQFDLNVSNLTERIADIQDGLGASPGSTQILLEADTRLEGRVNGWQLLDRRTEALNIRTTGSLYTISEEVQGERTKERTETVQRETPVETAPLIRYGGPLLLLVGLLGAGAIGVGRATDRFAVEETTREQLSFQRIYDEYEEWISIGAVPDESDNRTRIILESLEDAVDVAIDTNNRVIEDRDSGTFTVLTESVRYIYVPAWLDGTDVDSADLDTHEKDADNTVETPEDDTL